MKNANVYKLCDVDLEVTSIKTEIKINVDIAFYTQSIMMVIACQAEISMKTNYVYKKVLTKINAQCVNVYVHTCVYSQQCLCDDTTGIIIDVVAVWKKTK